MAQRDTKFDPLWVPILSHYRADDGALDHARVVAHLEHLRPFVRQYLVAGTTGDGWTMADAVLEQWLALCSGTMGADQSFLIGAFAADTSGVIARARAIEAHFAANPPRGHFAGLTLCAPVDPAASQETILAHFEAVLAETTSPIAIYQLPQITHNEIATATFERLAADPRVILFKDTSGTDRVAREASFIGGARLLRGAEGRYADHLGGRYDGWLLSTANVFGRELRAVADRYAAGEQAEARALSDRLDTEITRLFAAAQKLDANAFADANRGADHIRAHGDRWRSAPPLPRFDGSTLPEAFLAEVATILAESDLPASAPYLAAADRSVQAA